MDIEGLVSIANLMEKYVVYIFSVLFSLTLFSYIRARAGSAGFIQDRIWLMLGGKKKYDDPVLQEEYVRLRDYEKFNYVTGIRFSSWQKIHENLFWLRSVDVGLEEVVKIKKFYDCDAVEFKRPNIKLLRLQLLTFFSFFFLASFLFAIAFVPYALLKIKKTETYVWASSSEVYSWNWYGWHLTAEDCAAKLAEKNIGIYDREVVCELLSKEGRADYLDKVVLEQKVIGSLIWSVFFLFMYFSLRDFRIAKKALGIYERASRCLPRQLKLFD